MAIPVLSSLSTSIATTAADRKLAMTLKNLGACQWSSAFIFDMRQVRP